MDMNSEAWIAAVGAPWAMAPHPNFSQDVVTGPGLLALVAQFRIGDLERYEKALSPDQPQWVSELVQGAKSTLLISELKGGVDTLWQLSANNEIPATARVAAALFASVAEVELDEIPRAIDKLLQLHDELLRDISTSVSSIALGLLTLQIASRQYELFDYAGAAQSLEKTRGYSSKTLRSDAFPVSLGIGWDSRTVLLDVQDALSAHARELGARMEGFQGSSWVDVVKSRASWLEYRGRLPGATRDRKLVQHWFDEAVGANRGRRSFHREDPIITPALESLLVAELTGNVNGFMSERTALAQIRVLQHDRNDDGNSFWDVQEALRLFRRSRSRDNLKNTLDLIYLQGPDAALLGDAKMILERSSFPNDVASGDLAVLSFAAQFLSHDDLKKAMDAALAFLDSPKSSAGSYAMDERGAWAAIAKLVPASGRDSQVAKVTLQTLKNAKISISLVESDLLRVLESIDWQTVEPGIIAAWRQWGEQKLAEEPSDVIAHKAKTIGEQMDYAALLKDTPPSDLAEYLVRHFDDLHDVAENTLRTADDYCISSIQRIQNEAVNGVTTFQSVDSGELATIFAKLYDRPRVWIAVAEMLTDGNVAREMKERSLQRFAEYGRTVIPEDVQKNIRDQWEGVILSKAQDFFFSNGDVHHQFAQAYRVGAVLGVYTRDETMAKATELSCSNSPDDRLAACQLLPEAGVALQEWEWAQLLLLQLFEDKNALVRSHAAKSLASISTIKNGISRLVNQAVVKALHSDGIHVPLMALHGLQKITHSGQALLNGEVKDVVQNLSGSHGARIIRQAANHALDGEHL